MDVAASGQLHLITSDNVLTVKTTRYDGNMCSGNPGNGQDDSVFVELYKNWDATGLIGYILFGHVRNRIADGTYSLDTYGYMQRKLPTSIGDTATGSTEGCYEGDHVHLSVCSVDGYFNPACWEDITKGSSWLYRWALSS